MADLFLEFLVSGSLVAVWLVSYLKPRWLRGNQLGSENRITKKSAWMKQQANRFANRYLQWTALPTAALPLLYPDTFGSLTISLYVGLGAGLTWLYSRRLNRQWKLWQQLGYDGPPALEEQHKRLQTHR